MMSHPPALYPNKVEKIIAHRKLLLISIRTLFIIFVFGMSKRITK